MRTFPTLHHTDSEFYATLGIQDAHIPHGPLMTNAPKTRATDSDALKHKFVQCYFSCPGLSQKLYYCILIVTVLLHMWAL